jgi:hydroxymethylpyrimidine/phosphomethylpyrimidine kinase
MVLFFYILKALTQSRGLEADQRVLAAHGCYALTATTGLTAQNTLGVQDIFVVPSEFVRKQINAGLEDVGADVVKLGKSFTFHDWSFSI